MKLELVRIPNNEGLLMKGVWACPDTPQTSNTVAIYLPGIVLGTTAVHRLAFQIAEETNQMGIAMLMCDHTCVGESEGEFEAQSHAALVTQVRAGVFVEDTLAMINWLLKKTAVQQVLLIGHCGGSLTALFTAPKHSAIKGLYLISTPMTPSSQDDSLNSQQAADEYYTLYKRKFFSLEAWKKLITGKSSYKTIYQTLKKKLQCYLEPSSCHNDLSGIIDTCLIEAFEKIPEQTKLHMVIGDRDTGIESFREFEKLKPVHLSIQTEVFPQTSHGFVTDESMTLLMQSLRQSLQNYK